jgi:hypothetical protein
VHPEGLPETLAAEIEDLRGGGDFVPLFPSEFLFVDGSTEFCCAFA